MERNEEQMKTKTENNFNPLIDLAQCMCGTRKDADIDIDPRTRAVTIRCSCDDCLFEITAPTIEQAFKVWNS